MTGLENTQKKLMDNKDKLTTLLNEMDEKQVQICVVCVFINPFLTCFSSTFI